MHAFIRVLSGDQLGAQIDLAQEPIAFGRSVACNVRLPDPTVSRIHFQIEWNAATSAYCVLDLDSSGGTRINGVRIERQQLQPGDLIQAGSTSFEFQSEMAPARKQQSPLTRSSEDRWPKLGESVARYELQAVIAESVTSCVYRACDVELSRLVALKILKMDEGASGEQLERFVRAMNAVSNLKCPQIISLYAAGRAAGRCWIAMECFDGGSLQSELERNGPLAIDRVLTMATDMAQALHCCEQNSVVHRNITPSNVLLARENGSAKLNNLMLAKALEGTFADRVTVSGQIVGELCYLPPERLTDEPVDIRSDIYGLGATLYTALTGRPPFESASLSRMVASICSVAPQEPHALQPGIPVDFSQTVMRMLEKRPSERFQSASEVLTAFRGLNPQVSVEPELNGSSTGVAADASRDERRNPPRRRPHSVVPFTLVGVTCIGLLLGLAYWWRGSDQRASSVSSLLATDGAAGSPQSEKERTNSPRPDADQSGEKPSAVEPHGDSTKHASRSDGSKETAESTDQSPATVESNPDAGAVDRLSDPSGSGQEAIRVQNEPLRLETVVASIDAHLERGWRENGIEASGATDEFTRVRRTYLDLVGRIPTVMEVQAATRKGDIMAQDQLTDQLLDDLEFARHWASVWSNECVGRRPGLGVSREGMHRFFRNAFAENRPWNDVVGDLITAEGHFEQNGAVNLMLSELPGEAGDAAELTAKVSRLLLGVQIQCTQCHNHPFNDWKQEQFWQVNSFFRQIRRNVYRKYNPETGRMEFDYAELVTAEYAGPVYFENRNFVMNVAFPAFGGRQIDASATTNRRAEFAQLLEEDPHHSVARAFVNRTWRQLFGVGFTRPCDDLGPHNPASHPELLDLLTRSFVASRYDVKQLVRWICNSRVYQLSSGFNDLNSNDDPNLGNVPLFSRAYPRRLSVEQLYRSILIAATQTTWNDLNVGDWQRQRDQRFSEYIAAFDVGDGSGMTDSDGTVPQALLMMNGSLIETAIATSRGTLMDRVLNETGNQKRRVETLYLATLGRLPSAAELRLAQSLARRHRGQPVAFQNLLWALLNTAEFSQIH